MGRIKAAPPFGRHLECLVLQRRGFAQVCLVGVPFLPSNAPKEQSLRCCEILVPLLQSPAPLTPPCSQPGGATWTLPFLETPPFLSSLPASLDHPPPFCQLTPLFTHQGGCYSLWQQGPWQPTSHLGEATLLPWQRRPSSVAARQCKFGKGRVGAGGRWRGWGGCWSGPGPPWPAFWCVALWS